MTRDAPAEYALSAITMLRAHQEVPALSLTHPGASGSAWRIVAEAMHHLGASAVELQVRSPGGRARAPIRSSNGDEPTVRVDLDLGGTAYGDRSGWSVGALVLYLPQRPSPGQRRAIHAVRDAYVDILTRGYELLTAEHAALTPWHIGATAGTHRPGTAMSHCVSLLQRLMHAHHAAYFSCDRDRAVLEYYTRSTWPLSRHAAYNNKPSDLLLSEELQKVLRDPAPTHWQDTTSELRHHLTASGVHDETKTDFVLVPIGSGSTPIGFFALAIAPDTPLFGAIQRPALEVSATRLATPAEFVYQRRFRKLIVDPVFAARDARRQDDLAFVLMPFEEPWSDRIWSRVLRPVLEGLGLRAIRADDLHGRDVMEDIWTGILQARVVVADISGRNANVFYELGIAHTLGRDVVLMTQGVQDIPFDLNRFRHVIYEDNLDGYDVVKRGVIGAVSEILRT